MSRNYVMEYRPPSVQEFLSLREAVGLEDVDPEVVREAMLRSVYGISVFSDGEIIACGRIVGDGSLYFYIQDVMVRPGFQRDGIAELVMDEIMDFLRQRVSKSSVIGVVGVQGDEAGFYNRFGFKCKMPDGVDLLLQNGF